MLYGRRVIEPQKVRTEQSHRRFVLDKNFQHKYSWYFVLLVGGGALAFFLPAFYFINQNFELFKSLAYDTQPHLVEHLEREVTWLRIFLLVSFVSLCGITLLLSLRMTLNLLSPLIKMEKHMHKLMLGHWDTPDFQFLEKDDFRDLSMTYDYLYRSLKANAETELKLLEKLSIDPQNREAYAAWLSLLSEKRARLGIQDDFITNENVVSLIEFDRKRRAS